jgi:hypothetical protein
MGYRQQLDGYTLTVKPYRVEFEFTEKGYSVIAAETPEAASTGILSLLKKRGIKNPVITQVEAEDEEQLELPFEPPQSYN